MQSFLLDPVWEIVLRTDQKKTSTTKAITTRDGIRKLSATRLKPPRPSHPGSNNCWQRPDIIHHRQGYDLGLYSIYSAMIFLFAIPDLQRLTFIKQPVCIVAISYSPQIGRKRSDVDFDRIPNNHLSVDESICVHSACIHSANTDTQRVHLSYQTISRYH